MGERSAPTGFSVQLSDETWPRGEVRIGDVGAGEEFAHAVDSTYFLKDLIPEPYDLLANRVRLIRRATRAIARRAIERDFDNRRD
ncbi:hypothetical protein DEI92_01075 [Curtobacterium sp. MCBD17_034]|nr:hypothetical protein DEI92_01075 [Curtobacterium sp. MCBD17_034]PZM33931.1 hypothetical protein DEI90_09625 [Curtobacterium sp. MCBD17_031]